jgi:hypothetical protein
MKYQNRLIALAGLFFFVNSYTLVMGEVKASQAASEETSASLVETYSYPRISPSAKDFKLKANNQSVFVYKTNGGPFASFSCQGTIQLEAELPIGSKNITISPKRLGIAPTINENKISFQIPGPMSFAIMVDGLPALYVFANPIERNAPGPNDEKVKYFKAGQVYEVGQINLSSDETLYIEGGAVIRGSIFASTSKNIRISGYGVLDGSYYVNDDGHRSILFEDCKNSVIENIIMIEPTSWMIVLGLCENVTVQNTKQLGFISTSDGVDIVGSKHIRVLNSFIRSGDDCIVVKAFDMSRYQKMLTKNFSADVEDVEANGCTVISHKGGQAFEIGHELTTNSVKNIRFVNCDVLGVHDLGGVFGIHNTDRALISDVVYEDIRVEHYYNKLIDFRIIKSRYFKDKERGRVQQVLFKNIDVTVSQYNPGYSISTIGGYDADHKIENVVFDNFRLNGVKVMHPDQLDLFTKQATGIIFK